jgi:thiol-disulfide isomerase/thioredoxin
MLLLAGTMTVLPAAAQDADADQARKLKANPNDTDAITAYVNQRFGEVARMINADPKAAREKLDQVRAVFDSLEPEEDAARQLLSHYRVVLNSLYVQIQLAMVTLEDLKAQLDEDPTNVDTIQKLGLKIGLELRPVLRTAPDVADQKLKALKDFLATVREKAKDDEQAGRALDGVEQSLARMAETVVAAKNLLALIGQDAAPLEVDAWANGTPLTDADLKGKVVLLDFWAVWCRPCISTFPRLRQWYDQYPEDKFVIIGLTRYYNYTWDDERARAKRSQEKITEEAEHEMLVSFAEHHKLQHRFALQKGTALSDFYGVTVIPQVVVIDQSGKIRLIRVGSEEANAQAIDDVLKTLLVDGA